MIEQVSRLTGDAFNRFFLTVDYQVRMFTFWI
jgi:hypothetical protein